ncbi:MAG: IS66 family insertion sequence element accessory protein TnpB [Planctomycetes bacterium]|nr:IS66 family insertion sequence element accessory protein TnpB [Planctomycetota bacterium]
MLSLPSSVRVFLAAGATDMRKSIDGLAAATRRALRQDPFTGDLFVFCNRRRDRVKILYWERSGFWLLHKRLESGTFSWPSAKRASYATEEIDSAQLAALLGGLVVLSCGRKRCPTRRPRAGDVTASSPRPGRARPEAERWKQTEPGRPPGWRVERS